MKARSMLARRRPDLPEAPPDQTRVRRLFDTYFEYVWRLVRRLGVGEAQADDAAQQVFCVIVDRLDELDPEREKSFLTGTALRVAANHRRSLRRRREVTDTRELEDALDPRQSPEELVAQRRARVLLDHALDALSLELREAFVLYELEDASLSEIATLLAIPRGTVASRLRRAREQFLAAAQALAGGHRE